MKHPPPPWAARQEQERSPVKAARLVALLWLREQGLLLDASKTEIAEALGVSRWTLDRDMAMLDYVQGTYSSIGWRCCGCHRRLNRTRTPLAG